MENERPIIQINNLIFAHFYEALIKTKEQEALKISDNLSHFLESLDQDTYGNGMICEDINFFDNWPKDLLVFIHLVKKAVIQLIETDYLSDQGKQIMSSFIVELEDYYNKRTTI